MTAPEYLGKILGVPSSLLENLDRAMVARGHRAGVLDHVAKNNEQFILKTLKILNSAERSSEHVRSILRKAVLAHEKQFLDFLNIIEGKTIFEKEAALARKIAKVGNGFVLKREKAREILVKRPPKNVMKFLGYASVEEMLAKEDITEVFVSLRFIEDDAWMHETFDVAYSGFTPADFEEREIELRVLSPRWKAVAEKFVAKKHHNVSHLKEFGVIFLNPVAENIPGKFLRDFALLLHYFHEVAFYSKLFRRAAQGPDFAERLKSFLRGDVKEVFEAKEGEWLIVQRYLWKENPSDPRLFLPRVNPESLHWSRGERDLAVFGAGDPKLDLEMWKDLDSVGGIFKDGNEEVVSFDLEDKAMTLVSFMEGKEVHFTYHQREALWTKLFEAYVGGEEKMEKLLIENFDKGIIRF